MIILKKNWADKKMKVTGKLLAKMKKVFGKLKVQLYMGYVLTFTAITVIIFTVIMLGVRGIMVSQIGQSRLDVLKQISERSNSIKNSIITLSNLYRYDGVVYGSLCGKAPRENVDEYLKNLKDNYDKVFQGVGLSYDVVIIGTDGFRYASDGGASYDFDGLQNQLWFKKQPETDDEIAFISSFLDTFNRADSMERYVFGAIRRVRDSQGNVAGTILVNMDESYLEELYASYGQKSNIYIFDSKGNIVSSKDNSMLGKNFIGVENFRNLYGENETHTIKKLGVEFLLSNCYDSQTGWTIVEEMPKTEIMRPLNRLMLILAAVLAGCLAAGGLASWYVAGRVSKPILKLCRSMNQVRQGNFDVSCTMGGYEEVDLLKDSFNDMAGEIRNLMASVQQKELNKRKSEMDFLRAQINPHFLYNTLFSIQCMTELGKNGQAVLMMSALIDLLKKTLSVDTDFITLREEFESTEKYLALQQIRYGEKIHFECVWEQEIGELLIPALIIQPIVENAIFHGLEAKEDAGMIIVEAALEERGLALEERELALEERGLALEDRGLAREDRGLARVDRGLLITVSDDGMGMGEQELKQLYEKLDDGNYQSDQSIGLRNVQNRIKINFGPGYGLSVVSQEGIGTSVTMRLPAIWYNDRVVQ